MKTMTVSRIGSSGWIALALAGCSAQTMGTADDGSAPDGGAGSDPGGPGGSGAAIAPMTTTFADERGDVIDFDAGDPVFTHAGPKVELGGASCPDVFVYGYLLDEHPPFTRELTPNPLRFAFAVRDSGAGDVAYRVRRGDTVVRDWTRAAVDGGVALITLHRDGETGIRDLGSIDGTYTIDARQGETTASTCWRHHPLAPPVSFSRNTPAFGDALPQWTFAANSPISRLVTGHAGVYIAHIRHPLAEPVSVSVALDRPEVAYTETVVTDFVAPVLLDADFDCLTSGTPPPRCTSTAPAAIASTAGTLGDPRWQVDVLDAFTGAPAQQCHESGGIVTCDFPARRRGDRATELLVVSSLGGAVEIVPPSGGELGEFTFAGNTFTGIDPNVTGTIDRCQVLGPQLFDPPRKHCSKMLHYQKIVAIDRLHLDVAALDMRVKTAMPGATLSTPPYVANGITEGTPLAWDSGDDDVPGAQ